VQAIDEGRLQEETVPIEVTMRDGTTKIFDTDEHPRRDSTMEKMASLKPLHPEIENFPVTAGNASGLNDAGAALMLVSAEYAQAHGLEPMGKIVSWASTGTDPADTGLGPILAIPKALERAGLRIEDVDLAEINEAFASVPLAACRKLGLSEDITNVSGSGCSLGHPVAATGCRMIITTMYELRRRGGGLGLASMCAGGGMGSATVFEVYPG
jgi:acetyl-CoA C-acetyltransferase